MFLRFSNDYLPLKDCQLTKFIFLHHCTTLRSNKGYVNSNLLGCRKITGAQASLIALLDVNSTLYFFPFHCPSFKVGHSACSRLRPTPPFLIASIVLVVALYTMQHRKVTWSKKHVVLPSMISPQDFVDQTQTEAKSQA